MLERLKRFWNPHPSPVEPQFDEAVRWKLEREGKHPNVVMADAAEPLVIPVKPRLDGFTGMVRFEMTLSAEGQVQAVQMDGAPFNQVAALEAWAHAWTFKPALLEGKPHPCRMTFEVQWSQEAL
jgi:hypothetical protein